MEHIAAFMLIIGCSPNLSACRELPAPVPVVFEAGEECLAERPFALSAVSGQAEKIIVQCFAVDPAMEEEDAELVWDVAPDGKLTASLEVPDVTVASNSTRNRELSVTLE